MVAHARVLADAIACHHPGARLHALVLGGGGAAAAGRRCARKPVGGRPRHRERRRPVADACARRPRAAAAPRAAGARPRRGRRRRRLLLDGRPRRPRATGRRRRRRRRGGARATRRRRAARGLAHARRRRSAASGLYTPDFLVVERGQRADGFLDWYRQRMASLQPRLARGESPLVRNAARRRAKGILTLPCRCSPTRALDDPGLEVSAWNLHSRPLTRSAAGLMAGGRPAAQLPLRGLRSAQARTGSRATPIACASSRTRSCASCARTTCAGLSSHGWRDLDGRADIGRRLPNGLVFDARMLGLFAEAAAQDALPSDVFTSQGCARADGLAARSRDRRSASRHQPLPVPRVSRAQGPRRGVSRPGGRGRRRVRDVDLGLRRATSWRSPTSCCRRVPRAWPSTT